jgi:DUF4097 and DUF4098 domain-containing protein YvlB
MASENGVTGCILKVEYEITVPLLCNITINNNLGDIDLKNVEGRIDLLAKFGNISVSNIKGSLSIDLALGDIRIRELAGTSIILANHSHVEMDEVSGRHKLKLINSDLSFRSPKKTEFLQVEAKNGNVLCSIPNTEEYNYDFSASYGEIVLPDAFKSKLKQQPDKMLFFSKDAKNTADLHIVSEFGTITLIK